MSTVFVDPRLVHDLRRSDGPVVGDSGVSVTFVVALPVHGLRRIDGPVVGDSGVSVIFGAARLVRGLRRIVSPVVGDRELRGNFDFRRRCGRRRGAGVVAVVLRRRLQWYVGCFDPGGGWGHE